ncbi:MAG: protein-L-isoaspartate(D-aspartate) O-methyltransferase [Nanoarchaeota archaeon]
MDYPLLLRQLAARFPARLVAAFEQVRRDRFVLPEDSCHAWVDAPLDIGHGQTISQPTTVFIMLEALDPRPGDKVLEVGAGSGWNAALLGNLVGEGGEVWSTEIIPSLAQSARANIRRSGMQNVHVLTHDGSIGLEEHSPYDRIIVTAACPELPLRLLTQLRDNGKLIAPVATRMGAQEMILVERRGTTYVNKGLGHFVFVPLRGKAGYASGR